MTSLSPAKVGRASVVPTVRGFGFCAMPTVPLIPATRAWPSVSGGDASNGDLQLTVGVGSQPGPRGAGRSCFLSGHDSEARPLTGVIAPGRVRGGALGARAGRGSADGGPGLAGGAGARCRGRAGRGRGGRRSLRARWGRWGLGPVARRWRRRSRIAGGGAPARWRAAARAGRAWRLWWDGRRAARERARAVRRRAGVTTFPHRMPRALDPQLAGCQARVSTRIAIEPAATARRCQPLGREH